MFTTEIIIILATITLLVLLSVFIPTTSHYSSEKPQTISLSGPPADGTDVANYDSFISVEYRKGGEWVPTTETMLFDTGSVALILPYYKNLDATKYRTIKDNITEPWGCPAKILKGPIRLGGMEIPECQFIACTGPNTYKRRTHICGASISSRNEPYVYPSSPIVQVCKKLKRPFFEVVINTSNLKSQVSFFSNKPPSYSQKNVGGPFPIIPNENWTAIAIEGIKVDGTKWQKLPQGCPAGEPDCGCYVDNQCWGSIDYDEANCANEFIDAKWCMASNPANKYIGLLDTGGGPIMINDDKQQSLASVFKNTTKCPGWLSSSLGAQCFSDQITVSISSDFEVKYPNNGKTTTVLFPRKNIFTSSGELNFGGQFFLYGCNVLYDINSQEVYLQPK